MGPIKRIKENGMITKYRKDFEFRTLVNTLVSSAVTLLIAGYHFVIALFVASYASIWHGTLAGYYFALDLARVFVLSSHGVGLHRREDAEQTALRNAKNFLFCGALLVPLAFAFSGVLVLIVVRGFHTNYMGHLIFAAALYAVLKVTFAIKNMVKAGRRENLTVRALRYVNIADALVSIVSLQAAMLAAFSTASDAFDPNLFNTVTGGIVGVLILALGTYMILRGYRGLHDLKSESGEEAADKAQREIADKAHLEIVDKAQLEADEPSRPHAPSAE